MKSIKLIDHRLLQAYLHDTVSFVKMQSLQIVFKLLSGNAEQEQNLLRLGVNKLVSPLCGLETARKIKLTISSVMSI